MQKLLSIKIVFLLLFLFGTGACNKNKMPETVSSGYYTPEEDCQDYVFDGGEMFDQYFTTGAQYTMPFFNPNNGDEFVYVKRKSPMEVVKHTISTGEEVVLCNTKFIDGPPQWGKQGWIIFSVLGNTIWKIREDGSQLTQLSANGSNLYNPIFNQFGDQFIHAGTSSAFYKPIRDLSGNIVDSLKYNFDNIYIGSPCCPNVDLKNGFFRYSNHNSPQPFVGGFCKLKDNETIEVLNEIDSFNNGEVTTVCKNDKYLYYVQHQNGLFRLDLATRKVDKMMNNCRSRYITSMSMSPDGNSILFERVRGKQTEPGGQNIDEQSEIFLYNVVLRKEKKILWEE